MALARVREEPRKASEGKISNGFHYGFLAFAAVSLYLNLFVLPATPIAGTDLDQRLYLHNAARMFDGQVIYRDFFQFTPPGTELFYFALFKIFGLHSWIPSAALLGLGLGLTWLCLYISRSVMSGFAAYLPAAMFLALAFQPAMDGSHHWFSMAAATGALALLIPEITLTRLAGAGMLCALASFFTQPRGIGVVVAVAIYLAWKFRRRARAFVPLWKMEATLAGTFIASTLALNLYFMYEAGLRRFWWCTVTFGLKYYPAESTLNSFHAYLAYAPRLPHLPHVPEPGWVFIHALLPLIYLIFFGYWWVTADQKPDEPWDRLMLISLVGLALFLGVAPAPVIWRLRAVALPGMIVFAWFFASPKKLATLTRGALWVALGFSMVWVAWDRQTTWHAILDTPTGRAAFFDRDEFEKYQWVAAHTHPSEPFFDCSGGEYFLLGLRSPAMVSFLSGTDYLRPEQVDDLVRSLEARKVRIVVWCPDLAVATRPDDHLAPLRLYLRAHYHAAGTQGPMEWILIRNDRSTAVGLAKRVARG